MIISLPQPCMAMGGRGSSALHAPLGKTTVILSESPQEPRSEHGCTFDPSSLWVFLLRLWNVKLRSSGFSSVKLAKLCEVISIFVWFLEIWMMRRRREEDIEERFWNLETLRMLNIGHKFYICSKKKEETCPLSLLGMYLNKNDIVYNYLQMWWGTFECVNNKFWFSLVEKDEEWWEKTRQWGIFTWVEACLIC